jgi:hypothetical protein
VYRPTFPNPCTATRAPLIALPREASASSTMCATPRDVAVTGRVGIHHPGHDLLVRAEVRRRNVTIRPDQGAISLV